jgi:hypothetical protein
MVKKVKNIIYLFFIMIFLFFISIFYFSSENIKNTNKIRSSYIYMDRSINLPLLINNTKNIIESTDDVKEFKENKKKYKFFDLIEN